MPDAKNPYSSSGFIDFVEQDVGVNHDPFTGVVFAFPADVRKHGQVCGCVNQSEQNPLGCVGVAGKQIINDGCPVC